MSSSIQPKKDHWNSQAYNSAAGFVPKLTSTVVSYLDAQPSDSILDIGCGDGELTARIARDYGPERILGLDASKSFIDTAKERDPDLDFLLHDATALETCPQAVGGEGWDKVFSNAAMHWILRKEATRTAFFENVHRSLKPGGKFVFEMGGKGNVAEIHAAATAALVHAGLQVSKAREASPWFFPSIPWMEGALKQAGFEVVKVETEYRPSLLKADALEGWVKLMCAQFLESVDEDKKDQVIGEICDTIEMIITREEDGSKYLGYVRLRGVAKKP